MSEIDWDSVAKKAEGSFAAQLQTLVGLVEEGRLDNLVFVADYRNKHGAQILWAWSAEKRLADGLGLLEYAKHRWLRTYDDAGLTEDEVEHLEPDA